MLYSCIHHMGRLLLCGLIECAFWDDHFQWWINHICSFFLIALIHYKISRGNDNKTLCGWESELRFWIAHGSLWDSPTRKNASVEYIPSYAILTTIFWVKTQSKVTSHATLCNMDGHKCLFEIQYLWKLCVMPWSLVTHSYRLDCPSWFGNVQLFCL